jgi:hypothetical protein
MQNLRSLSAEIRFQNPSSIARVSVLAYSAAAHSGTYGQGGYLAGLSIYQLDGTMLYFTTDWHSARLKRIALSSTGAEILQLQRQQIAVTLSPPSLVNLLQRQKISFELTLDSRGTPDTMATLHEEKDFRLLSTVRCLRDAFSTGNQHNALGTRS